MSNDKTTLADAQPGGRVRLGDGLLPCPFCGDTAERIDFGAGSGDNEGGSCVACTGCGSSGPVEFGFKENFLSNWNRRAFSAQPSPGGQGDALAPLPGIVREVLEWYASEPSFEANMSDAAQEAERNARANGFFDVSHHTDGGCGYPVYRPNGSRAEHALTQLEEWEESALASRQPVGQDPVAVVGPDFTIFWAGDGPIAPLVERHGLKRGSLLYAAPPAQAVDPWSVIDRVAKNWDGCSIGAAIRAEAEKLIGKPAQAVDLGRWSQRHADDLHVAVHTALSVHAGSLSQKKRAAISAYVKRLLIDSQAVGNG